MIFTKSVNANIYLFVHFLQLTVVTAAFTVLVCFFCVYVLSAAKERTSIYKL